MNLDEAIKHCEEVAEENYGKATEYLSDTRVYEYEEQKCLKCADEHMQLAEWLRDYKRLLEQEPSVSEKPNNCEMRDATLEERESIDKYIKNISKPTGVKFGALEQEPIVTSTEDNAEMIYPQVEGITPTVVNEDIYECSCGYGWDKNKKIRFHFCPNCGKAVGDSNDYKYIKSISNPTGIEFDIDIPKKIESYEKLLKHPVVKHIMDMDEEQEQIDFVRPHKKIPVTLTVSGYDKLIDLANAIESDDSGYWTNKKILSALKNISSIKPQLCEDTISRQAVMDYIHRILNQGTGKKKSFEFIQKYVKKLPSVKPQIQTGHWEIANSFCTCDQCGYETRPWNNTLFCPNCGARMESEKNE